MRLEEKPVCSLKTYYETDTGYEENLVMVEREREMRGREGWGGGASTKIMLIVRCY